MSANPLDVRLAHLEGAYEQISDRLNGFDLRFASLEEKIDRGFDNLRGEFRGEIGDLRRLVVTGAVSILGLILVSIILPYLTHVR